MHETITFFCDSEYYVINVITVVFYRIFLKFVQDNFDTIS